MEVEEERMFILKSDAVRSQLLVDDGLTSRQKWEDFLKSKQPEYFD